jgi:hypothetical protein
VKAFTAHRLLTELAVSNASAAMGFFPTELCLPRLRSSGYGASVRDDVVAEGLLRAAAETLRPFVKRLLEAGVPYGHLEARVRALFVEVAERDLAIPGRRQTDSRIALLTGVNRKEVRRLRGGRGAQPPPASFSRNQAAALISRWMADRRATDRHGRPRAIPYQAARGPSFVELARAVTVDLPPRALLDELLRTGAVELRANDLVAVCGAAYVPARGRPEKLAMLAEDPAELIETMLRNVLADEGEALLQRKVFYDNLGAEGAARVRREMRREGERFLRRVDRLLAKHDRDRNPRAAGGERRYAGLGVYYFEAPRATEKPRARRKRRSTKEHR